MVVESAHVMLKRMDCEECAYTYAWKMADDINGSNFALMLPEYTFLDDVFVPSVALAALLASVQDRVEALWHREPFRLHVACRSIGLESLSRSFLLLSVRVCAFVLVGIRWRTRRHSTDQSR